MQHHHTPQAPPPPYEESLRTALEDALDADDYTAANAYALLLLTEQVERQAKATEQLVKLFRDRVQYVDTRRRGV